MGVPKFYRFISERYPLINMKVERGNAPVIDNLYLDMNGVVHNCVRGNGAKDSDETQRYHNVQQPGRTNEDIFLDVFKYIDNIFSIIRPRKLLYFAIDGVAPRAKMNQQRSRRFRSAQERTQEHARRLAEDPMYVAADSSPFDSNCISPGTEFMQQLTEALDYYVNERLTNNPLWADIEVILSGAEAYGEGEHKIMEYIRAMKVGGKIPPNTRHCLYGLDADLIMLALLSHEPHFFLLREKVDFTSFWKKKGGPRLATFLDTITFGEFELLSIGLLREYLAMDVGSMGNAALPFFDVERVVDDFVFMLMLVGNDFLPHLPTVEIADGSVCAMLHLYKRLLPRIGGYLTDSGRIAPDRVELFVAKLSLLELRAMKRNENERGNRREKSGSKPLFYGFNDLDTLWGFSNIFTSGMDFDIQKEIANCRKDTHSELHVPKKRRYYGKKLGTEFMQDINSSVDQLTTHYLQGVVWTMKYYFEGCYSWRWFYPYHYAPFPSDLTNIAEKIDSKNLKFSRDTPFLPFQQLMSVLPPASAPCVPLPYRKLMSDTSPIRDFYVENFETDLNGKKNDWEAVVLLPFVDETRLISALATIPETDLTETEKQRNTLGDSVSYRRCTNSHENDIKSPFPHRLRAVTSCAKGEPLRLPSIPPGTAFPAHWVLGTHAAGTAPWVSDMPTLHPIPHSGRLENISVNLFGYASRLESLVVHLGSWKAQSRDFVFFDGADDSSDDSEDEPSGNSTPDNLTVRNVDDLVKILRIGIGSSVWTHFPWRLGGTVEAIIDENRTIRRAAPPLDQQYTVETPTNRDNFETTVAGIVASLMEKAGIEINTPKVLLEVQPHRVISESLFGNPLSDPAPLVFPIETVLTDDQARKQNAGVHPRQIHVPMKLSVGSKALYVGRGPFFGSKCVVKELFGDDNARVLFHHATPAAREMPFGYNIVEKWQGQRWKSLSHVASRCSLPIGLTNAFLGSVRVRIENGKDEIDLGLGVKYASRGLHIPGFAKVNEYGTYFFSEKTIALLSQYKEAFPELFSIMDTLMHSSRGSKSAPVYSPKQLFPNASTISASEAVTAIASWISASEVAHQPLVPSASFVLHRDAVFDLERHAVIAKMLQEDLSRVTSKGKSTGKSVVVSQQQLRTGSEALDWENDSATRSQLSLDPVPADGSGLRLGDRVVNRLAYNGIPFGLRGTVVGIHSKSVTLDGEGNRKEKSKKRRNQEDAAVEATIPSSCTVEVVFDEEFISGGDLNGLCNPGKGKAVPPGALYTVRPDRDNKYYDSNYARVAKGVKTRPANLAATYNRRKAIAKAAEECYRTAIDPRPNNVKLRNDNRAQPRINGAGSHHATKPAVEVPSNTKPVEHSCSTVLVDGADEIDQAAALTAQLKKALGISSSTNEAHLTSSTSTNSTGQAEFALRIEQRSPNKKQRHKHRKSKLTKESETGSTAVPAVEATPTIQQDVDSNCFTSVWNALISRSNDQNN